MTTPAQPSAVPPAPRRTRRAIIVGVAAGAVVAAVGTGLVLAGRDGNDTGRAAGTATSAVVPPGGTSAAATTTTSPTPTGPPATTPATGPAATSAAPAQVAMPNLIGRNAAAARIELERLGFSDVRFGSQDAGDPDVVLPQNWTVTRQSTAAGARVPTGTTIVLICTRRV